MVSSDGEILPLKNALREIIQRSDQLAEKNKQDQIKASVDGISENEARTLQRASVCNQGSDGAVFGKLLGQWSINAVQRGNQRI
jgi:hypothetical protein